MKIDIAKEADCGSIHITIEYKSEYWPLEIRTLWLQVAAHAERVLDGLDLAEAVKKEDDDKEK